MEDRYEATALVCHACAARERKAEMIRESSSDGAPTIHGLNIAVNPEV